MRRLDFRISDTETLNWIMSYGKIGHLGIIDEEGYPRIVPLNFVWLDGAVYFHGALDGEKFEIFKTQPKVTFGVDIPYSTIPSYWSAKEYACPATIFFKSAHIRGTGTLVENVTEKAKALQSMMEKDQPEGGYKPITIDEPLYQGPLKKTAVFKIVPVQIDVKVKFGQNLNPTARQNLIAKLEERNQGKDRETAEEIRKTMGSYQSSEQSIEYLHKYMSMPSEESLILLLVKNRIRFSSPARFNDPFDCKVLFNPDVCDDETVLKFHENAGRPINGQISEEDKEKWKSNLLDKAKVDLQPEIDNGMGVLCLTTKPDNILMWAHYAKDHEGICLQFNKKIIEEWAKANATWTTFDYVRYSNGFNTIKDFVDAFPNNMGNFIFKKAEDWRYENEWRILVDLKQNAEALVGYHCKWPENALTGIIFGLSSKKENRERICKLIKKYKPSINLYVAERKRNAFGLDIIPLASAS